MAEANYDWQGLVLVVTAMGILAIFLVPHLAKGEGDNFLLRVLVCGLLLKLGSAMVRYWINLSTFGWGDAFRYDNIGRIIAQYIQRFEFREIGTLMKALGGSTFIWGSKSIDLFTGVIYSAIGPTIYGGYVIYALIAFLGSYCFYKAFRVAFPEGNKRLYALLVFLSPSILYWANGIGKDAAIFFCIGLSAYGSAQLTRNRLQGLIPLVLGLLGTLFIRPHIAMILAIAFFVALIFSGVGKRGVRPGTLVIGFLAIGGFVGFLLPQAIAYVGLGGLSPEDISSYLLLDQAPGTYLGGSAFQTTDITNPLNFPMTMITILFRPFPWEAHNLQALIQSLEGVLVMCLMLWRIKSLGKAVSSLTSNTYLLYTLIYIIVFVIAFSSTSNFGILARQRVMLLPFFFMLIAHADPGARIESKPK
ncbi:hypothetical protein ACFLUU_02305 [Chloroflexota bacterium]